MEKRVLQPEGRGSVKQCAKIRWFICRDWLSTTRRDRFSCVAVENRGLVAVLGAELASLVMGCPLLRAYSIKGLVRVQPPKTRKSLSTCPPPPKMLLMI